MISDGDHIQKFTIKYDGDNKDLRNGKAIGHYTIHSMVKGGSPIYRYKDSGGGSYYILRDPNGDKSGENEYGSIWKGVVMIIFLIDSKTLKYKLSMYSAHFDS